MIAFSSSPVHCLSRHVRGLSVYTRICALWGCLAPSHQANAATSNPSRDHGQRLLSSLLTCFLLYSCLPVKRERTINLLNATSLSLQFLTSKASWDLLFGPCFLAHTFFSRFLEGSFSLFSTTHNEMYNF